MSSSRRKKSYNDKLKQFQNRNIFAGIVLVAAVGFSIWLMLAVMAGNTPKIHLSTNYVQYSGTQKEIPFALESCQKLVDSLRSEFRGLKPSEPLEFDSSSTEVKLSKTIDDNDVLIVYFNGHLVKGKDGTTVEYLSAGDYEGSQRRGDFGTLLGGIDESNGKLKILLIDAGRFTRSPVFPGRELNDFQDSLAEAIARNQYELKDNFWIIVSHSPNEFSRVSTPLQSSLFSKAVAASVKHFADSGTNDLSVLDFFLEIRKRTASWSRNLKNNATQTPMLMYPGKGVILQDGESASIQSNIPDDAEKFQWKVAFTDRPDEDSQDGKAKKDEEDATLFKQIQSGEQAAERLLTPFRYDSMPLKTVADLESFLELGERVDISNVNSGPISTYEGKLVEEPDRSRGEIDVDKDKLLRKQETVQKFRRALLGITVLARFQNELKYWEDDEILSSLEEFEFNLPKLDRSIADRELTKAKVAPTEYSLYARAFDDFYRSHIPLLDKVKTKISTESEKELTPTQAEMFGRMSERYLPIIAQFNPAEEEDESTEEQAKTGNTEDSAPAAFVFDFASNESKARFGSLNTKIQDLYDDKTGAFGSKFESQNNDTAFRFLLAARGSEGATAAEGYRGFAVAVPQIEWPPIIPRINSVRLANGATSARVNPTYPVPVKLEIDVQNIENVDLKIAPVGDTKTGRLQYSFEKNGVGKSRGVLFKSLKARETVDIWFTNLSFDESDVTIPFEVTATAKDDATKVFGFEFDVTLTKDADLVLVASREFGKAISNERLLRWGRRDFPEDTRPLMVKSLANIASTFELSVENKSSQVQNLSFELYNIAAGECEVLGIRPDCATGFNTLSGSLFKIKPGNPLPSEFQILGKTKGVLIPAKSDNVSLEFEKVKPEKEDESELLLGLQPVSHCLLLVGTNAKSEKVWFQWIGFQPQMPADVTPNDADDEKLLSPLSSILKGFELADKNKSKKVELERLFKKAWPKDEPVAKLTIVSPKLGQNSPNQPQLFLDGVFSNGNLDPGKVRGSDERMLVMDLFGVPGYRILRQSNIAVVGAKSPDLIGLRVDAVDSGCVCYPATWSLLNFDSSDRRQQTIFMHSDPSLDGDGILDFDFLLPASKRDVLSSEPTEFIVSWKGRREPMVFPNQREHFVQIGENGLEFKSAVSSHRILRIPLSNIADESVLEIKAVRAGQERAIGSWIFKRESFGTKPKLILSENEVTRETLQDVKVTADISQINPFAELSHMELLVNEKPVKKFFKNKFEKSNSKGIYDFNLRDLASSVDFQGDRHSVELVVTDFFGEKLSSGIQTVQVTKPTKKKVIAPKVKPKDIHSIQLKFVDADGKAMAVAKSKIKSIRIKGNAQQINWMVSTENTGEIVAAWKKDGSLKLFNLKEGQSTFIISVAVPGNPKIANSPDEIIQLEKTDKISQEGQIVQIKFK